MLTRCGMLLHSFQMQRRLTWSHSPKAAAFFFHSPFLALPCQNYTNPCQLIMEDGGSTNIHVWLGSCNLANSGDDDQHGKSCTCRLFHGKKNFFYTICKAYLCVEKQQHVTWKENSYAGMSSSAAYPAHLLTRYDLSWLIADQIRIRCTLIWSAFVGWPLAAGRPIFFVYRNCVEA